MFIRRAEVYNSSCSQVILLYLHPFRRNSLFCGRKSQNSLKALFWGFKPIPGHDVDISKKLIASAYLLLVMISSMYVPICNHFHARQANSG